ncbi:MAG: NAD(P)/FAD-dependent oxidoreductase [Chloroflexota bacterium]
MSTKERDVIVVGGGPAGATTATSLAQKGYDVLLLDRKEFPRDKICGDAVPAGAIETMTRLGMGKKIQEAEDRGELYRLKGMRLVSPKGHLVEAQFHQGEEGGESYVAPRIYFDRIIQNHAVDSGAEFCKADVKGPMLNNGRVVGVKARLNGHVEDIRAKVVIDGAGVTSPILRSLRPESNQHVDLHRAVALRAYIDDIEIYPGDVEFFLYNDILPGYAWIFPTGEEQANIGLGMRLDLFKKLKKNLKKMLKEFMEMPDIKKRLKRGGEVRDIAVWQLNFGSQKQLQHVYDGALLVGDAAGFINPLTGGGIHNAIISADLASKVVDDALKNGDTSREYMQYYEKLCHEAMWDSMKNAFFMQRTLMRFPFLIDFLVRRMRANNRFTEAFLEKL